MVDGKPCKFCHVVEPRWLKIINTDLLGELVMDLKYMAKKFGLVKAGLTETLLSIELVAKSSIALESAKYELCGQNGILRFYERQLRSKEAQLDSTIECEQNERANIDESGNMLETSHSTIDSAAAKPLPQNVPFPISLAGHHQSTSVQPIGNQPEMIRGLHAWLQELGLAKYAEAMNNWILDSGACNFEEIIENADDVAQSLCLTEFETSKIQSCGKAVAETVKLRQRASVQRSRFGATVPECSSPTPRAGGRRWHNEDTNKGHLSHEIANKGKDICDILITEDDTGLCWCRYWQYCHIDVDDKLRMAVTRCTMRKVKQELGLRAFGESASGVQSFSLKFADISLFKDCANMGPGDLAGKCNLLGRYDVLCVKTSASFDRAWKLITDKKEASFWVLHVAAVNIGESQSAADFPDFACSFDCGPTDMQWGLDEDLYLVAMGKIYRNIFEVCAAKRIDDMIFFPFGMGAFLRFLHLLDPFYGHSSSMSDLRRRLASRFIEELENSALNFKVHLCIAGDGADAEACSNADAFVYALTDASPTVKNVVTIYPGADSLELARLLANGSFRDLGASRNVAVVNGANRQLIGNHWFAGGARRAIDENLHRRSWKLSATAYLLNDHNGSLHRRTPPSHTEHELEERVLRLGGHVTIWPSVAVAA